MVTAGVEVDEIGDIEGQVKRLAVDGEHWEKLAGGELTLDACAEGEGGLAARGEEVVQSGRDEGIVGAQIDQRVPPTEPWAGGRAEEAERQILESEAVRRRIHVFIVRLGAAGHRQARAGDSGEESRNLVGGHGPSKIEALERVEAHRLEGVELLSGLDAFHHRLNPEPTS